MIGKGGRLGLGYVSDFLPQLVIRDFLYADPVNIRAPCLPFQKAQHTFKKGCLARAVGAQYGHHLRLIHDEIHMAENTFLPGISESPVLYLKPHNRIPPVFLRSNMKHGAPIRDVNMETGISDAVTDRAAVSMISMNTAPNAMLAGMTELLSLPNIMRTIWGMSSPTHPIWPHMDTTAAVTMADPTITSPRILLTGIPRDLASSSGRDMELSFHLNRNSSTLPIRMNGAPMTRVALVVLAMLPISQ